MIRILSFWIFLALAAPVCGQDIRDLSVSYLDDMLKASVAQSVLGKSEAAPEFLALIGDDKRWLNPAIKPGIGAVIGHMALFGAEEFTIGEPLLAHDAARVTATVRYRETPDFNWTVEVDFISIGGMWKLRAVNLIERRPLSTKAGPEAVLRSWLSDLIAAAERRSKLDKDSWQHEMLTHHWAFGGGYLQRGEDCNLSERAACLSAKISTSSLWAAAILGREKSIVLEDFSVTPDGPKGTILVEIPRRTTVSRHRFAVTLKQDRRFGWQIGALERLDQPEEPALADLSVDTSSGTALVRSLLGAILGEDAPTAAQLVTNPDVLLPYFAKTREGRRAMARFISMSSIVTGIGADPSGAVIEDLGNDRLRLTFKGSTLATFSPILVITSTDDGAKIAGIEGQ